MTEQKIANRGDMVHLEVSDAQSDTRQLRGNIVWAKKELLIYECGGRREHRYIYGIEFEGLEQEGIKAIKSLREKRSIWEDITSSILLESSEFESHVNIDFS